MSSTATCDACQKTVAERDLAWIELSKLKEESRERSRWDLGFRRDRWDACGAACAAVLVQRIGEMTSESE